MATVLHRPVVPELCGQNSLSTLFKARLSNCAHLPRGSADLWGRGGKREVYLDKGTHRTPICALSPLHLPQSSSTTSGEKDGWTVNEKIKCQAPSQNSSAGLWLTPGQNEKQVLQVLKRTYPNDHLLRWCKVAWSPVCIWLPTQSERMRCHEVST